MSDLTSLTRLFDQLGAVRAHWAQTEKFTAGTLTRYDRVHVDWLAYAEGGSLDSMTSAQVAAFARSPLRVGRTPTPATQAVRLAVIDTTYQTAHALGLTDNDPIARLPRPTRNSMPRATVTDDVLHRAHALSKRTGLVRRASSILALAECGASTAEMAAITVSSFDAEHAPSHVRLTGTSNRHARTVELTPFARTVVRKRLKALRKRGLRGDIPVLGDWTSGQEGICMSLRNMVKRDPATAHVTATGLNRWAARTYYLRSGDLPGAAHLLGTSNYTSVGRAIGVEPGRFAA